MIDSIAECKSLTVVERQAFEGLKATALRLLAPERIRKREAFIASKQQDLMRRTGMSADAARAAIEKQIEGILVASIELPFDNPELDGKTVGDVLDDPAKYDGETLADPLEGVPYGRGKAKVMRGVDGPFINSFAHGGARYQLRYDATHIRKRVATSEDPVAAFIRMALNADINDIEIAEITKDVSRRSGAGVRDIRATLKAAIKEQEARAKEEKRKRLKAVKQQQEAPPTTSEDGLPTVVFDHLSKMTDRIAEILLDAKVPFYQRGNKLVRVVMKEVKTFHDKTTIAAELFKIDPHYMRDTMCRKSRWIKLDKRSGSWDEIHPDEDVVDILLSKFGDWKFPTVIGIIGTPTLRPDGTILSKPGYDPETRLLLVDPPKMDPIPERPTKADAVRSLKVLNELYSEFPFVGEVAKSVALSGVLTVVCRGAFPLAPVHIADATAPSSGKSYLFNTVSYIATGQAMPVTGAGPNDEEMEKRIGADMMSGRSNICIDNMSRNLGGEAICRLTEQTRPLVRILGLSRQEEVDAGSITFFVTGINVVVVGEMCRRCIVCSLDPRMENPELKQFKGNPVKSIMEDRGKYIAAALTIVRAYIVAGKPDKLPQLNSYGEWSDTIRSALVWVGAEDPVKSMNTSRAEDPELGALLTMLTAFARAYSTGSDSGATLKDAFERSCAVQSVDHNTRVVTYVDPELRAAVVGVMPPNPPNLRNQPTAEALGYWMRRMKGRRIGGMWFCKTDGTGGDPSKWWVAKQGDDQQPAAGSPQQAEVRRSSDDNVVF